jgi:hypothetical protein
VAFWSGSSNVNRHRTGTPSDFAAFLEHLVYDSNGQLLSGNLADYLIPTATDFPKIRAIALENHRLPSNPLGVKAPARARSSRSVA